MRVPLLLGLMAIGAFAENAPVLEHTPIPSPVVSADITPQAEPVTTADSASEAQMVTPSTPLEAPATTADSVSSAQMATPVSVDSSVATQTLPMVPADSMPKPEPTTAVDSSSVQTAAPVTLPTVSADSAQPVVTNKLVTPVVTDTATKTLASATQPEPISESKVQQPSPASKRLIFGFFLGASYNDYYGSNYGLDNIKGTDDYDIKLNGQDDFKGNFWGYGANVGVSLLLNFSDYLALHTELGLLYHREKGKSNVSVILDWNDFFYEDKLPERADFSLKMETRQLKVVVPLLFRAQSMSSVYVEAGPQFAFSLYSVNKSKIDDGYGVYRYRESDFANVFEFDAAFGFGIQKKLMGKIFDLGIRAVIGITDMADSEDPPKTLEGLLKLTYWLM